MPVVRSTREDHVAGGFITTDIDLLGVETDCRRKTDSLAAASQEDLGVDARPELTRGAARSLTQGSSQRLSQRRLLGNAAGCVQYPGQYGICKAHSNGSILGRRQQDETPGSALGHARMVVPSRQHQ